MPSYSPITPNSLLKGAKSQLPTVDISDISTHNKKYTKTLRHMNNLFDAWWRGFEAQVFDSLATYPKWRQPKRNLMPGDICVLRYDQNLGKPRFRLCEVSTVQKDEKGDIRTVAVLMRPRDSREKPLPYIIKENEPHVVPVQRLSLIYSKKYEDEAGESLSWPCLPIPSQNTNRGEKSDTADENENENEDQE